MTSSVVQVDPVAATLARALGAQYEVVRLLGRGGMGAVYLAREPFLERDVAVKVLPGDAAAGDARERFLREARTAARLSHPNIVPLYTFGQAEDLLYYVMGYVDGDSLEGRLKREGRLPPDEVRRIVSELADALHYAHELGVVHRDVKPDNVLLDRGTGRAMLTDFGIAKQRAGHETLTQTGVVIGTPHYMSPEQASGERDIDGRSDIYSLGVMAYRMATGRLPFEGGGMREVLVQHATRAPIPPTQIIPTLPLDLATVITRALAKAPPDRWPTARAMRDALHPDSEESQPEELRTIEGGGVRLLLLALGLLELAYLGARFRFLDGPLTLATIGAAVASPLVGALMLIPSARRFGIRAALDSFWAQPRWWSQWWPRRFRRAGDVWDRLPRPVRRLRTLHAAMMATNIVLLNAMIYGMTVHLRTGDPRLMHAMNWAIATVFALGIAPVAVLTFRIRSWTKSRGLSRHDFGRLLAEPTAGTRFWNRPHIAALLADSRTAAVRSQVGQSHEVIDQIARAARDEAASPHAAVFREAATAAAALGAHLKELEDEMIQLARDIDPRERERIRARLDTLGATSSGDSAAKQQMRELLDRQLLLLLDLEGRRDALASRRDHLKEQLNALWLHLAALRAAQPSTIDVLDVTGRIRSICREIEHRLAGVEEIRRLS